MSDLRFDKVLIPKVIRTDEGYIKGEAIVTRVGVFKYKNHDGTERLELRHPDDVLHIDSLASLKAIPITNDHPSVLVNSDNAASLMVGMTGETLKVDDNSIITSIAITHKDGIEAINRGKRELSLGYRLDVVEEVGTFNGEPYTHRQTNIKYNHLAIVDQARAGRSARVNFDGALFQCEDLTINQGIKMDKNDKELDDEKKEKDEEVDVEMKKDKVKKDSAVDSQKNSDRKDALIDQLKSEIAELKANREDSIINERVKHRLSILSKASKVVNTDELIEKSDREIMESVILIKDSALDISARSDAYVEGRFDAIIDSTADSTAIMGQMENINKSVTNKDNGGLSMIDVLKTHSQNKRA